MSNSVVVVSVMIVEWVGVKNWWDMKWVKMKDVVCEGNMGGVGIFG